ncbi:MAG TPA: hypothetical protein VGG48_01810 [Rhizomicrobium sp.]|jgi:hypothetical protein
MQQSTYTAAELSGDADFPTHLSGRQAQRLIRDHDHKAAAATDGSILVTYICTKGGKTFEALKRFTPTVDGTFRAAPILLWLGY